MENKKQGVSPETGKFNKIMLMGEPVGLKDIANTLLMLAAFIFYSLTFFVPKFYGITEDYVGVFVFLILAMMAVVNVNPVKRIKERDIDFYVICILAVLVGVNILVVNSGKGCFFVAVNFALIWYLSGIVKFSKWQIYLFSGLYTAMLLYWFMFVYTWMFADYTNFAMNTNTAATFTVFSMLCAIILFEQIYFHNKFVGGLLFTLAIVKCFQLSLYHRSRGAFIMLGMFLIFRFVIPKRFWDKKGFLLAMFLIGTLGSLLFVGFYIWLGTTGVNFQMPFFYKNIFSGREAIWLEFWNLFKAKPLTGIGTNVTIQSFFEFNVHNAMYNILVIHGVFVFAGTLFLMYRRISRAGRNISAYPVRFCALAALFAVFVESYFDVDLIWSNYSLNVLFLTLVLNNSDAGFTDRGGRDEEE